MTGITQCHLQVGGITCMGCIGKRSACKMGLSLTIVLKGIFGTFKRRIATCTGGQEIARMAGKMGIQRFREVVINRSIDMFANLCIVTILVTDGTDRDVLVMFYHGL